MTFTIEQSDSPKGKVNKYKGQNKRNATARIYETENGTDTHITI